MTNRKFFLKYDWLTSLSFLWIWIVAQQWLTYTEPVWFKETTSLVGRTLIIIVMIEVLLPFKRIYRILLECGIILLVLRYTLIEYDVYMPSGEGIEYYISGYHPYIWFAFSTALICLCLAKFLTTQRRILVFMGLNIVAMAIIDSFSSMILWDEVAWMVLSLMGWLVSHHFQEFKKKYPEGWRNLIDYPLEMIVHIVLIFSVIFLLGVNMPKISPILQDPYSAWTGRNESVGDREKQPEIGALDVQPTVSGYSNDDNKLGGAFEFDYSPVMTVRSAKRNYWRGETRRIYSGTGWENESKETNKYDDVVVGQELKQATTSMLQTEKVQQTMIFQNSNEFPVLFGAYAISSVQTIEGDEDMRGIQWKDSQAELHWNTASKASLYPKTYSITSEVPIVPIEELRKKSFEDLYGDSNEKEYLQIPDGFPTRVKELAKDLTESAVTPYDKITLLQTYLQTNFEYTNTPNLSLKKSDDFVDSFLFEIRAGYCNYFSTSMAMMTRSLGIPARWVKGYAPGSQPQMDEFSMMRPEQIDPDSYRVTNADAHSWVEVYFGPYGWIPIEATPGFTMPTFSGENSVDMDEKDQLTSEEGLDKAGHNSTYWGKTLPWIQGMVIAVITVLLLWLGYIGWRSGDSLHFLIRRLRMRKKLTPAEKVVIETERCLRYLHKQGMTREKHETLREVVMKWQTSAPNLEPSLSSLLQLFEKARYSPETIASDEWRVAQKIEEQLKVSLRAKNKR
ncbi:DUF4129 domain-containing transglutaminase family protein [Paenibacillus macquariensis]|uniref:Transglutaminase-like domain-containing protein n=1 Tax=Paenibacillus macquariensis TaxID=948756 RepID=A0ABY1K1H9_9BACL|nr:transglutaminase domain-containing protein [Paenibacillus macquariensis]MEC0091811.1 transglutaminase domain-containing protein [Paenibacillus macquariensis]OAB32279.1 hypothetical protein PMSM_16845 [Paenibacillus macquariensis subsp. macquariensis]SIR11529.1 protein of unknown function [Paenibacillus macquariensis]